MKTLAFTYTKTGGEVSTRYTLVLQEPAKNYLTLDLSELAADEAEAFVIQARQARERFDAEMLLLQREFDLVHSIRQFSPEKMSKVDVI